MKLALADLRAHVGDPAAMRLAPEALFAPDYARRRAALIDPAAAGDPGAGAPEGGGTVLVAAADAEGQMVSLVQSNYKGFGSGIVVPGTGISLQNRGFGFSLDPAHPNVVAPGKRPFQTIIPGFASDEHGPAMAFGMMGGPMQAQGHLQLFERIRRHRQTPQAAIDAPRWRALGGRRVAVEAHCPPKPSTGCARSATRSRPRPPTRPTSGSAARRSSIASRAATSPAQTAARTAGRSGFRVP